MKRFQRLFLIALVFLLGAFVYVYAEGDTSSPLESENMKKQTIDLDKQILEFSKKIQGVVTTYNLVDADIKLVPYQTNYIYDKNEKTILFDRHYFDKDEIGSQIIGMKKKSLKIYTDGTSVTKLESEIYYVNYNMSLQTYVKITDPSPTTSGTDDIEFTYAIHKNKIIDLPTFRKKIDGGVSKKDPYMTLILKGKKLSEMKNTTAFPIANNLRNDFYIPHLMYFYDTALSVGETYQKSMKDGEVLMEDFLKTSTSY